MWWWVQKVGKLTCVVKGRALRLDDICNKEDHVLDWIIVLLQNLSQYGSLAQIHFSFVSVKQLIEHWFALPLIHKVVWVGSDQTRNLPHNQRIVVLNPSGRQSTGNTVGLNHITLSFFPSPAFLKCVQCCFVHGHVNDCMWSVCGRENGVDEQRCKMACCCHALTYFSKSTALCCKIRVCREMKACIGM